jgi:hypothetical protein
MIVKALVVFLVVITSLLLLLMAIGSTVRAGKK